MNRLSLSRVGHQQNQTTVASAAVKEQRVASTTSILAPAIASDIQAESKARLLITRMVQPCSEGHSYLMQDSAGSPCLPSLCSFYTSSLSQKEEAKETERLKTDQGRSPERTCG